MTIRQIGIDIGKNTFHVIGLGAESGDRAAQAVFEVAAAQFYGMARPSGDRSHNVAEAC